MINYQKLISSSSWLSCIAPYSMDLSTDLYQETLVRRYTSPYFEGFKGSSLENRKDSTELIQ